MIIPRWRVVVRRSRWRGGFVLSIRVLMARSGTFGNIPAQLCHRAPPRMALRWHIRAHFCRRRWHIRARARVEETARDRKERQERQGKLIQSFLCVLCVLCVFRVLRVLGGSLSIGAKMALSISSGALRLCDDKRAARHGECCNSCGKTRKILCKIRILRGRRAALLGWVGTNLAGCPPRRGAGKVEVACL